MNESSPQLWTREGLELSGFAGFTPLSELRPSETPTGPGVYVVLRMSTLSPQFLEVSPAGWFKETNPSVSASALRSAWVDDSEIVYIGKAGSMRKRLSQYRRLGAGKKVGHWGGRYIWQLADSASLLIAWLETPAEDPRFIERQLITHFVEQYGRRPFANLAD